MQISQTSHIHFIHKFHNPYWPMHLNAHMRFNICTWSLSFLELPCRSPYTTIIKNIYMFEKKKNRYRYIYIVKVVRIY